MVRSHHSRKVSTDRSDNHDRRRRRAPGTTSSFQDCGVDDSKISDGTEIVPKTPMGHRSGNHPEQSDPAEQGEDCYSALFTNNRQSSTPKLVSSMQTGIQKLQAPKTSASSTLVHETPTIPRIWRSASAPVEHAALEAMPMPHIRFVEPLPEALGLCSTNLPVLRHGSKRLPAGDIQSRKNLDSAPDDLDPGQQGSSSQIVREGIGVQKEVLRVGQLEREDIQTGGKSYGVSNAAYQQFRENRTDDCPGTAGRPYPGSFEAFYKPQYDRPAFVLRPFSQLREDQAKDRNTLSKESPQGTQMDDHQTPNPGQKNAITANSESPPSPVLSTSPSENQTSCLVAASSQNIPELDRNGRSRRVAISNSPTRGLSPRHGSSGNRNLLGLGYLVRSLTRKERTKKACGQALKTINSSTNPRTASNKPFGQECCGGQEQKDVNLPPEPKESNPVPSSSSPATGDISESKPRTSLFAREEDVTQEEEIAVNDKESLTAVNHTSIDSELFPTIPATHSVDDLGSALSQNLTEEEQWNFILGFDVSNTPPVPPRSGLRGLYLQDEVVEVDLHSASSTENATHIDPQDVLRLGPHPDIEDNVSPLNLRGGARNSDDEEDHWTSTAYFRDARPAGYGNYRSPSPAESGSESNRDIFYLVRKRRRRRRPRTHHGHTSLNMSLSWRGLHVWRNRLDDGDDNIDVHRSTEARGSGRPVSDPDPFTGTNRLRGYTARGNARPAEDEEGVPEWEDVGPSTSLAGIEDNRATLPALPTLPPPYSHHPYALPQPPARLQPRIHTRDVRTECGPTGETVLVREPWLERRDETHRDVVMGQAQPTSRPRRRERGRERDRPRCRISEGDHDQSHRARCPFEEAARREETRRRWIRRLARSV